MDFPSPYFVHHSDHLGLMLVPTRLNGPNYQSWSKSMIHALTAKNKIRFINGSIKPPLEIGSPTEFVLYMESMSQYDLVMAYTLRGTWFSKTSCSHQNNLSSLEDFKDQFSQNNTPTIYQIQRSLASISQGTMMSQPIIRNSKVYETSWKHIGGLFPFVINWRHT